MYHRVLRRKTVNPIANRIRPMKEEPLTETAEPPALTADLVEHQWTTEDAKYLYNLDKWGHPYFSINGKGNVAVQPMVDAELFGDRGRERIDRRRTDRAHRFARAFAGAAARGQREGERGKDEGELLHDADLHRLGLPRL